MVDELKNLSTEEITYGKGLVDMMAAITYEFIELGKFEAQRRMINTPQDILNLSKK